MASAKKSFLKLGKKELIIAGVALILVLGVSFAWLTQTLSSTNDNVIVAGKLRLQMDGGDPIIKIGGEYGHGYPMTDTDGMQTSAYGFMITNTGTEDAYYHLYLDDVASYTDSNNNTVNVTSSNRMDDSKLMINVGSSETAIASNNRVLSATGNPRLIAYDRIAAGSHRTYYLRVWIRDIAVNADVVGKIFAGKLRIEATQNNDDALGGWSYYNDND